jgi:hypothetical protein
MFTALAAFTGNAVTAHFVNRVKTEWKVIVVTPAKTRLKVLEGGGTEIETIEDARPFVYAMKPREKCNAQYLRARKQYKDTGAIVTMVTEPSEDFPCGRIVKDNMGEVYDVRM